MTASRRDILRLAGLPAAAAAGGGLIAGCGEKSTRGGATQQLDKLAGVLPELKDPAGLNVPPPDVVGTRPVADGYTKFPAQLADVITEKPGKGGAPLRAITPVWGPAPPGGSKNSYLVAINNELGTPVEFSVQDGLQYANKVGALLGARDVPDLLCVPSWEIDKLARFGDAVNALFEDLTPHLAGAKAAAYPMLQTFPVGAWRYACWNEKLMSVPNPTDGPFPWVMFYRKDLLREKVPTTIDELYQVGKKVTDPDKGVWAFADIFAMVQMLHKSPGTRDGWRVKADGTPEFKYETAEFKAAAEFMSRLYSEGLVHPDIVASRGADMKQLFQSGKILITQDGMGMWQPMQAEQQNVTKGFEVQPMPLFSATGGDPLAWGDDEPVSYTFIKKGLPKERVEEILRIINWCSAPFGTQEFNLREFGVEGKHHKREAAGPAKTDLGFKEIANQFFFISGRRPVVQPTPQTPAYVPDMLGYSNAMVKFLEKDPWAGLKFEMPARYKAGQQPFEDKFTDVVRGRRPISDIEVIAKEWRAAGGDEARALLGQSLANAGR